MSWLRRFRRDKGRCAPPAGRDPKEVFTRIFESNFWRDADSRSGAGSIREQTRGIEREIPRLLRQLKAGSLLDIPCGDFHWMQHVDLSGIDYLGADVVAALIAGNKHHEQPGRRFELLDLLNDSLPRHDVILVRDCLVHFSYSDIRRALRNILRSGSSYLLTTTFPARPANQDIQTGQWRALNLQQPPFSFPPPQELINEGCTEDRGKHADKSLGLWNITALRERITAL
ncbi:MAG: class I SAM-dependent methyltransferase [Nevskiales bacterium]